MSSAPALRYAAFAALATAVNVATQVISGALYAGRHELYAAKYRLDRRYVFQKMSA